jgi:hypothetical protein
MQPAPRRLIDDPRPELVNYMLGELLKRLPIFGRKRELNNRIAYVMEISAAYANEYHKLRAGTDLESQELTELNLKKAIQEYKEKLLN